MAYKATSAYRPSIAKAHQVYKNAQGVKLPGVTTITGMRPKHLENWVAKLVSEGYNYQEYMRDVAAVGTCAHELVMADLIGRPPRIGNFTKAQIDAASECHRKVIDWATSPDVNLKLLESEVELVSEKLQVGGTMDIYATLDGVPGVFDLKTSDSGIYLDNFYQTVAYSVVAMENGREVKICGVIRAAKDKSQLIEVSLLKTNSRTFKRILKGFCFLREMYDIDRDCRRDLGVR